MTLIHTPAWRAVAAFARSMPDIKSLFTDEKRAKEWSFDLADDFSVDFSKQQITHDSLTILLGLARQQDVETWRTAMFSGVPINRTENRSVLHTALRANDEATIKPDTLDDVQPLVEAEKKRLYHLADAVRSGAWLGATGLPIKTVLHIGIGGSHLGPEMVVKALRNWNTGPEIRFIANVDPADMAAQLHGLDPATTLVIIASKTFTTQETMANAHAVRLWLTTALGDAAVAHHFIAASTNAVEVVKFGIMPYNMFPFAEWVGGRFSLWSSIGLPILLSIGEAAFEEFLSGARDMDEHFCNAAPSRNIPLIMALIGVWNRNFLNMSGLAILPYAQDLAAFPAFLQQLEMESNGKSVDRMGEPIHHATCPMIFGQAGTNGQHAFYQQIHQGTDIIPCDFIVPLTAHPEDAKQAPEQHHLLVANAFAQSAALLQGRESNDGHRRFSGNRPSTTITMNALNPRNLGRLIALYEHKVAVQGWLWGINSFDQFGVELGKEIAKDLLAGKLDGFDASTQELFRKLGKV